MENENKLPEDFKKRWVAALRSGEYEQFTGGKMANGNATKFCCLGVARIVYGVDKKHVNKEGCYRELPAALQGYCEVDDCHAERLVHMNDIQKKSFSEIAYYIEANL